MFFSTIASSSSGNCTLVYENNTYILVDAGISMKRILAALAERNIELSDVAAIFITHEHSDHISGLKMLLKYYDIPVMAPKGVACGVENCICECCGKISEIPVGEEILIGDITVKAFHTPHDTGESVGYKFTANGRSFAIATDMGHISAEVLTELIGVNACVIEANHDLTMLKTGPYPYHLKQRILSDRGHLSNKLCASLAGRLFETGTRKIVLGHLSKENNTPDLALSSVTDKLAQCGATVGKDVEVYIAPKNECGPVLEV